MKTNATVTEIKNNGMAQITVKRKSACAECHSNGNKNCKACDLFIGDDKITAEAYNTVNAEVGDEVLVESSSKYVILNALIVFIFPLVIGFIGYTVSYYIISLEESYSALCALGAVCLSYLSVYFYARFINKNKDRIYITEIKTKHDKKE